MREMIPVARRVVGESNDFTLKMGLILAEALYRDPDATLDDLREAVMSLERLASTTRRLLGSAHPLAARVEQSLQNARAALSAREVTASGRGTTRASDVRSLCEAVEAMTLGGASETPPPGSP